MQPNTRAGADFLVSKARGQRGERRIEAALVALCYGVRSATDAEQRTGVDLVLTRCDGSTTTIEIKSEETSYRTGNVFVEIVADDVHGRAGWAYTSAAVFLVHLTPQNGCYLVVPFAALRQALPRWAATYRHGYGRSAWQGVAYRSEGVLVPLRELRRLAVHHGITTTFTGK